MIKLPKVNKEPTDLLSRTEKLLGKSKHVALGLTMLSIGLSASVPSEARVTPSQPAALMQLQNPPPPLVFQPAEQMQQHAQHESHYSHSSHSSHSSHYSHYSSR